MKHLSLDARGVAHHFLLALTVVGVAIFGSYYLMFSKADTISAGSFEAETMSLQPVTYSYSKAATTKLEAETLPKVGSSKVTQNRAASNQKVLQMNSNAATSATITTTGTSSILHAMAYSSSCRGYANIIVSIDGVQAMNQLTTATNTNYSAPISVPAGQHRVTVKFANDVYRPGICDRNLFIDYVSLDGSSTVTNSRMPGTVETVNSASGGKVLRLDTNTTASMSATTTATASSMTVTAKGESCNGDPNMQIQVDGNTKLNTAVSSSGYKPYTTAVSLPAGKHTITATFNNDAYSSPSCDRNLLIDKIDFSGETKVSTPIITPSSPTSTPSSTTPASDGSGLLQIGMYSGPYEYSVYGNRMKADGFSHVRVAGDLDDATMTKLATNGASVLYTVDIGHRTDYASDEVYTQKYLERLNQFLGRYGPRGSFFKENPSVPYKPVTEVGIMNEPNFSYVIPNGSASDKAKLYAKILVASYPYIKASWPDVTVVGFDAGGASAAAPGFIKAVHEQDPAVAKSYDAIGFQPYTNPSAPDQIKTEPWGTWSIAGSYADIKQTMQKYGTSAKPVWITEIGWSISKANGGQFSADTATLNQQQQAAYTIRLQLLAMRLGIARTYQMYVTDADYFNGGFYSGQSARQETGATAYFRSITAGSTKTEMANDGQQGQPFVQRITTTHGQLMAAWTQDSNSGKFTITTPSQNGTVMDMMGNKIGSYSGSNYQADLSGTPVYLVPSN